MKLCNITQSLMPLSQGCAAPETTLPLDEPLSGAIMWRLFFPFFDHCVVHRWVTKFGREWAWPSSLQTSLFSDMCHGSLILLLCIGVLLGWVWRHQGCMGCWFVHSPWQCEHVYGDSTFPGTAFLFLFYSEGWHRIFTTGLTCYASAM